MLREGHLAHALFDKPHQLGFYADHWLDDMSFDIGPAVTWFGLAAVVVATAERRVFSKRRLLVVLFVCYAAPFWCAVPPESTLTRGYISYGVGALLLVRHEDVCNRSRNKGILVPGICGSRRPIVATAALLVNVLGDQISYQL